MTHTILVLGAGKIGRMVTHLLASSGDYEVRVADSRPAAAEEAIAGLSAVTALGLSFEDAKARDDAMCGAHAVISFAPFSANPLIAERARAG
jgi:saccharopine dehydrogenase-like NADP-dependent oxidoreductase